MNQTFLRRRRTQQAIWIPLFSAMLLTACHSGTTLPSDSSAADSPQSKDLFAMDTVMSLQAYGPQAETALEAAAQEIQRLDTLFSISSPDGEIGQLNQNHTVALSTDTETLLRRAQELAESTNGAFDDTIAPVMDAWGFSSGDYRIPETDELSALLEHVDFRQVTLSEHTASIPESVKIDLGGIAKGFTSSRVMDIFQENGVTSGLVSLGGNVHCLGSKPDGSAWRIAIQDPDNPEAAFAVIEVQDKAVITSGGYQRYFEKDGVRYHHIINPETGFPAKSGLTSVTIISEDGTLADALSTSLFVMGLDRAAAYWQEHAEQFEAVFMAEDRTVYLTSGLAETCSVADGLVVETLP